MAGIKIYWNIPAGTFDHFDVFSATGTGGTFSFIARVVAVRAADNFSDTRNQYFYTDTTGTANTVYRIKAIGSTGELVADTGVFQPITGVSVALNALVRVDHNYQTPNSLTYRTQAGQGIPDATIRIYLKTDYTQGRLNSPVATTLTDSDGQWKNPVYLPAGLDYVVYFFKYQQYGPNTVDITV